MNLKLKENKISIIGFLLIILSVFLLVSNSLTEYIRPITSIFLMGSSKGKDIIFFGVFGSLLLLSPIVSNKIIKRIEFLNIKNQNPKTFIKIILYLSIITYLLSILLEIIVRIRFNVPICTTLITMDGINANTSSIIHTHFFKSVIGTIIASLINVPNGIHTGTLLLNYAPTLSYSIILILPIIYILNLLPNKDNTSWKEILLAFGLTLNFIALFDGGIFSNPGLISLFIIILILTWDDSKKIRSNLLTPSMVIIIIYGIEIIFGFTCGTTTYYDVYILNPNQNLNINDTIPNLEKISNENGYLTIRISSSPNYDEIELINYLIKKMNGKCDGFFITRNPMSYLQEMIN